jgi:trehalose synthase
MSMQEIEIAPMSPARFRTVLAPERFDEFERTAVRVRKLLEGRAVWNINSTARGGGVVELLAPLLAYARGVGVDARWVVIDGAPEFFAVTKRIHNRLHGATGDGGALTTPRARCTSAPWPRTSPPWRAACRRAMSSSSTTLSPPG